MKKTSKEKQRLESFIESLKDKYTIEREYIFHPTRKWRFDWAITSSSVVRIPGFPWPTYNGEPDFNIAIEYEGGVFTGGGHTRGVIYSGNAEKYNEAALMGWTVLRFTAPMVRAGLHEEQINRALGTK
jgi:hypothetical protein